MSSSWSFSRSRLFFPLHRLLLILHLFLFLLLLVDLDVWGSRHLGQPDVLEGHMWPHNLQPILVFLRSHIPLLSIHHESTGRQNEFILLSKIASDRTFCHVTSSGDRGILGLRHGAYPSLGGVSTVATPPFPKTRTATDLFFLSCLEGSTLVLLSTVRNVTTLMIYWKIINIEPSLLISSLSLSPSYTHPLSLSLPFSTTTMFFPYRLIFFAKYDQDKALCRLDEH